MCSSEDVGVPVSGPARLRNRVLTSSTSLLGLACLGRRSRHDRVKFGVASGDEACCSCEVVDGGFVGAGGGPKLRRDRWSVDLRLSGSEESGVGAGEEQGVAQAGVGDLVAVGSGDPFDEAVAA